jgi:hypothetical protein
MPTESKLEATEELTPNRAKVAAVRAAVKVAPSRPLFHLYAFLRGRPLAQLEARVSEHNLPSHPRARQLWASLFGEPAPAALAAWMAVPEERIRRYGPKLPRQRPQQRSLLAAGVLAVALSVTSPAPPEPSVREGCLAAIERQDDRAVVAACDVAAVAGELLQAAQE